MLFGVRHVKGLIRRLPAPGSSALSWVMSVVVDWNGRDLPDGLRSLPAGRYVVESIEEAPVLSAEEDAGLEAAIDSIRSGRGVDGAEARRRIGAVVRR